MKLAVIGNSHIGALKHGWNEISQQFKAIELVFFGSRGASLQYLELRDHRLSPTHPGVLASIMFTSGGRAEIDPAEFDAFLIYGLDSPAFFHDRKQFYSRQALLSAMEDGIKGKIYVKIIEMIRAVSTHPIYVGHMPLFASPVTGSSESADNYTQGIAMFSENLFSKYEVRMVAQPLETIVNGVNTDIKYSVGSRRLAVGDDLDDELHVSHDVMHMNSQYGRLWLERFFSAI